MPLWESLSLQGKNNTENVQLIYARAYAANSRQSHKK